MAEKDDKKEELHSEIVCYLGRTLKRQGTKKDKEGKEVPWKLWDLLFDVGGKYPWKCKSFDRLSPKGLQLTDLLEGEYYRVVYKVDSYQHPEYGPIKTKQAVLITKSSKDQLQVQKESRKMFEDMKNWDAFAAEYNEAMKENQTATPMHMLGAYIANRCNEEFDEVIKKCKQNFPQKGGQ